MEKMRDIIRRIHKRIWSEHTMILLEYKPNSNFEINVVNKFEFANEDNIKDTLVFENESYIKRYQHMLEMGEVGILGYVNDECVFRHWIQMRGSIFHEGTNILVLDEKSCYSHYVFCTEMSRKRGFHSESIKLIKNKFPEYKIYTLVDVKNDKSMRNYLNAEFNPIKEINVKMRFLRKKTRIRNMM